MYIQTAGCAGHRRTLRALIKHRQHQWPCPAPLSGWVGHRTTSQNRYTYIYMYVYLHKVDLSSSWAYSVSPAHGTWTHELPGCNHAPFVGTTDLQTDRHTQRVKSHLLESSWRWTLVSRQADCDEQMQGRARQLRWPCLHTNGPIYFFIPPFVLPQIA